MIISASCELLRTRGPDRVSVEDIIDRAGVTKSTFYNCFRSKHDLYIACLRLRHERRMGALREMVEQRDRGRTSGSLQSILSELTEQWFLDPAAELRALNHALAPHAEGDDAVGQVVAGQLREVREEIAALCRQAGLRDPEGFARAWEMVVSGALISALEGDTMALEHAQSLTQLLLAEEPVVILEDGT